MIELVIVLLFFVSIAAIVCLARIKLNNYLRAPLLIFCVILLLISVFLGILMADTYRIDRGAQLFIHNFIADVNKGSLPSFSNGIAQEEKVSIENIIAGLPDKDYKIQLWDKFGDLWEYHIEFKNEDIYFCAVDVPNTFLSLFAKTNYKLYKLRKVKE